MYYVCSCPVQGWLGTGFGFGRLGTGACKYALTFNQYCWLSEAGSSASWMNGKEQETLSREHHQEMT
jgi:hypothetical protein